MMVRSIDELAELSEELAVRRRFDLRNTVVVRWFFFFFMIVLLAMTGTAAGSGRPAIALLASFSLLVVVILFLAFRRIEPRQTVPRGRWLEWLAARIAPHVRAAVLIYLPSQYLLVVIVAFGSDNVIPWFVLFPLAIMMFRFTPSERILVHGIFVGTVLLERSIFWAVITSERSLASIVLPVLLSSLSINAIALGVGLFLTRRFRNEFLGEWSAARAAYEERSRMRQELEFAREIQLGMLPLESPEIDWLDIAALSLPATEVGGDYYDYFPLDEQRLAIVVGDVAGHGLASGIVLSGVRSCLSLLENDLRDPVSVIERIHHMIRKTARHRMLVTLSILLLDRETSEATLTSAGHPPIFRRRSDGEVDEIGIPSLPLGAGMLERFETRTFALSPGDVLFLQTDGVYEMRDEDGEMFGLDRLVERIAVHDPYRGSRDLRDAVIRDLWEFRGQARQEDDLTILVLTWK